MRRLSTAAPLARRAAPAAAAVLLIASLAAPRAGQDARPAPPKPLVPLAASTLATHPDRYYGEWVTLAATVEAWLSRSVFSVDQDRTTSTGQEVLILAPRLYGTVAPGTRVTVVGEVVRFGAADVADKAKDRIADLPPEAMAKYEGRPAILATSVINSAMLDLAMRLPPPMTPDEEAYARIMRRVGPAFAALRKGIEGSSAEATTENTAALKEAFTEVDAFWKGRGKGDARRWAQDARKLVETIDRAATDGKWEEVKASAGSLGKVCQSCHGTYRERFDDGSFRIKKATG